MKEFSLRTIADLTYDTSFLFPAGDWCDLRAHLLTLYSIAKNINALPYGKPESQRPPLCLEIGVRQGPSTMALLLAMRETNGKLISLDIDPVETAVAKQLVAEHGLSGFWDFHLISSDEFARTFKETIDFLWIDGDHCDPQPTLDFEHYAPLVRKDGMIAFHDYSLEPWRMDEGENGVFKCVEGVKQSGQFEVCVLNYSYGLVLMRKLWE